MRESAPVRQTPALSIAVIVTVVVTLLRFYFDRKVMFCGTPDSCSYLALGESLSRHQGFTQNFLYQYQFISPHLPSQGIEYWRTGTSLFLLLAQPFGGVTLHSAANITSLMAIFLALAAWRIAMDWFGDRTVACASYLICLVFPPIWTSATTPDSAIYYGVFVAWFFVFFGVRFRSYAQDAAGFACIAMVNLIRNDAILLSVPLVVILLLRLRAGKRERGARGASPAYALLALAAFALSMLPMNLIDFLVLHKAFPPGTGGTLYLTDLSDLALYKQTLNLHTMLAIGAGRLIRMRLVAIPMIVYRIVFLMLGVGAAFLPALLLRRRSGERAGYPEIAGPVAFFVTLVLAYGIGLPAIGTFSALRSFTGLLPVSAVLIVAAIRWIEVPEVFPAGVVTRALAGTLVAAYLISGIMQDRRTADDSVLNADRDQRVADFLASAGATPTDGTLVMTADPSAFYVQTAYRTLPIPNDNLQMMSQATHDLGATHILIDLSRASIPEADLRGVLHPLAIDHVPGTQMLVVTMPKP